MTTWAKGQINSSFTRGNKKQNVTLYNYIKLDLFDFINGVRCLVVNETYIHPRTRKKTIILKKSNSLFGYGLNGVPLKSKKLIHLTVHSVYFIVFLWKWVKKWFKTSNFFFFVEHYVFLYLSIIWNHIINWLYSHSITINSLCISDDLWILLFKYMSLTSYWKNRVKISPTQVKLY